MPCLKHLKKHLSNTAQSAKWKIFLGVAEIFVTALAKAKPHMSLKKISDKRIHLVYGSEVGNWTFFASQLTMVYGLWPF